MWAARTIARTWRTTLRTLESTRTTGGSPRSTLRTALENRLASNRNPGTRTRAHRRLRWRGRTRRLRRRRGIYRTRSGLRHDHTATRCLRAQRYSRLRTLPCAWSDGLRRIALRGFFHRSSRLLSWRLRRNRCLHFRSVRCSRRRCGNTRLGNFRWRRQSLDGGRRRWNRGSNRRPRGHGTLCGNRLWRDHARFIGLGCRSFSGRSSGLCKHCGLLRRRLRRFRFVRDRARRFDRRTRRWRRRRRRSCLMRQRFEHIAGFRDLRQIDLRLEFVLLWGAAPARRFLGPMLLDVLAHQDRFKIFNRTGMRLLLGHAHLRQCIENGLALYFQLSCQIINSNLHSAPKGSSVLLA